MKTKKILLIWDRIGDYHRARWKALAERMGNENVFAADLGSADSLYQWTNTAVNNSQYIQLSEKPVNKSDIWKRLFNFALILSRNRIRAVGIPGYGRLEYILFIIFARLTGCRVILFAESWYGHNALFNYIKGTFLRIFCSLFLVSGTQAFNHFTHFLRIPASRIKTGYSVVDNHFFSGNGYCLVQGNSAPTLLCIARFSPEKNLERLLCAFMQSKIASKYRLKLVGGGPLKAALTSLAAEHSNIEIADWVDYTQLPNLYHSAQLFILPSTFEPWGLVVNEAMAAGLPIIVSKQCGCALDLVDAQNGFIFDAYNPAELVALLDQLSEKEMVTLKDMGKNSLQKIAAYSPESWAETLYSALE